jgi:hypothetical protein
VRLNIISHLLTQIPYKEIHVEKWNYRNVKLAKSNPRNTRSGMWKSGSEITGRRLAECRLPGETVLFLLAAVDNGRTNKGDTMKQQQTTPSPEALNPVPSSHTAPDSVARVSHQKRIVHSFTQ